MVHQNTQKVTAWIPKALLQDAQSFTGLGITETLKEGLEQLITAKAYEEIRQFRGKVRVSIDLDALRDDRKS
jgi:hypothetical protein